MAHFVIGWLRNTSYYLFGSGSSGLGGIELMHMIAKGQMKSDGGRHRSVPEQFYDLVNKHPYSFRPDFFCFSSPRQNP
jgi:hypothetical protein